VLNYRYNSDRNQSNPPGLDWEHIVEFTRGGGENSVDNMALLNSQANRVAINHWFGSSQGSGTGFPSTGALTVRDYLDSIAASPAERTRWKLRAYRLFDLGQPRTRNGPRGRFQVIE
jgi:hypothetical protein